MAEQTRSNVFVLIVGGATAAYRRNLDRLGDYAETCFGGPHGAASP
jgi:hypothetical protein